MSDQGSSVALFDEESFIAVPESTKTPAIVQSATHVLSVPSASAGNQTVRRLHDGIISKLRGDTPLSAKTADLEEVRVLWERCGHGDAVVASSSCDALLTLVQNGKADFDYVIGGLLNLVPTARCLVGVVRTVTDLLLLQMVAMTTERENPACPYGIRSHPHPLIAIAKHRPDSWPLVQQQLVRVFAIQDVRITPHVVRWLDPFVKFALLEPPQSAHLLPLRMTLVPSLLPTSRGRDDDFWDSLAYIAGEIIPNMQVQTAQSLGELIHGLTTLLQRVVQTLGVQRENDALAARGRGQLCGAMVEHGLEVCLLAAESGMEVTQLLADIASLLQHQAVGSPVGLLLQMALLRRLSSHQLLPMLTITSLVLDKCPSPDFLLAMLVLPLLHVVSTPGTLQTGADPRQPPHQARAAKLLACVESYLKRQTKQIKLEDECDAKPRLRVTSYGYGLEAVARLVGSLTRDPQLAAYWLKRQLFGAKCTSHVSYHVTCIVSAILLQSVELPTVKLALDVLPVITQREEQEATDLLTLLLYKMNRETDPQIKMAVLHALPNLVTNKIAVGPVLKVIQTLSTNAELRPVATRMLSLLWQRQSRCFPYLQQTIMDKRAPVVAPGTELDQLLVAKAACIRDVCKLRPHQYGHDVLNPLSAILNESTSASGAVAASLALEGLTHLCKAEVVDIRTTWSMLEAKLGHDQRPLVVATLCRLFSLVPDLEVESTDYSDFSDSIVSLLWRYSESDHVMVAGAAFRALAAFPRDNFSIRHLPDEVTQDIREAAMVPDAPGSQGPEDPETAQLEIPGVCFARMLERVPPDLLKDYGALLSGLVEEEVAAMPRGVLHASQRKQTTSAANQNKAVTAVPTFLKTEYDRNRQPQLQAAMTVGLLFAFEPFDPPQRDERRQKLQVIQIGRSYHQTLYTILNELPVSTSDWHQALSLPQAWGAFMDRCLDKYTACRKAELALQLEKGDASSPEENQRQQGVAWLWASHKLAELITSSAKGRPAVEFNSLLALAGLALAVSKVNRSLDTDAAREAQEAVEFVAYPQWIAMVTDTILVAMDATYQPKMKALISLKQGVRGNRGASTLARCGAGLAASMLLPLLITTHLEAVYHVLDTLMLGLPPRVQAPGGQAAGGQAPGSGEAARLPGHHDPTLALYSGVALGLVLAHLYEEHFSDSAGTQAMIAVLKAVDALENVCLDRGPHRQGSLLGLAVCLSAMSRDGKVDTKAHVCSVHEKLSVALAMGDAADDAFEGMCLCLAAVTGAAYGCSILSQEHTDGVVARLYELHCDHPGSEGLCLALGLTCHLLLESNHPTVADLNMKLFGSWIESVVMETVDKSEEIGNLCYLKGVGALTGSENLVFSGVESGTAAPAGVNITQVIKILQHLVKHSSDVIVRGQVTWQLGRLHLALTSSGGYQRTSVPLTYNYLPETSVLRALVTLLAEAGKKGPCVVPDATLLTILTVLTEGPKQPLPPLNWAGLLAPLVRMSYSADVQRLCVTLALRQSATAPSTAMLVTSWMTSPLWESLQEPSKQVMFERLSLIIRTALPAKLKDFLDTTFLRPVVTLTSLLKDGDAGSASGERDALHARVLGVLRGLLGALRVADPPQAVTKLLYAAVETLYGYLPCQLDVPLYSVFCQCLCEAPDDVVDKVTSSDFDDVKYFDRTMFVRCYLVSRGKQPLSWLNPAIEAYMCDTKSDPSQCLNLLLHCFHGCVVEGAAGATSQTQWLLQLMGHIKNLATGKVPTTGLTASQVVQFLLDIFSAAVTIWSRGHAVSYLAPLYLPALSVDKPGEGEVGSTSTAVPEAPALSVAEVTNQLRTLLPLSLCDLLLMEPWKQNCDKFLDWLLAVHGAALLSGDAQIKQQIEECIYALRHTDEFRKSTVWGRAFSLRQPPAGN